MNEIITYTDPNNDVQLEVKLEEDTVWLTQAQMVGLFQSSKANISEHIKNIFYSNELDEKATVRKLRTVQKKEKERLEEDFIYIIWMLLFLKISPETLTTLTILIAQSPPEDREKMIGMILLLLNKR